MRFPITAAILAGGASSRMGTDKAELMVGQERMLERVVAVAHAACQGVMVVGRPRPAWWDEKRYHAVSFIDDAMGLTEADSHGPIAGVIAALRGVQGPVLALAVDMPALTNDALTDVLTLWEKIQPAGKYGVMARLPAQLETELHPMPAVYGLPCLRVLEDMWAEGCRGLWRITQRAPFGFWEVPFERRGELVNINDEAGYLEYVALLASPSRH